MGDHGVFSQRFSREQKHAIKAVYRKVKEKAVRMIASYTPVQMEKQFRSFGIEKNDAVLMHSAFTPFNGFQGNPGHLIDCLLNVIGPEGHLFMMSMAYTGSASAYLSLGKPFDVRKTVSQMGIVSETFRRRPGVVRSANPLHPVLAFGPRSDWIVSGHEQLTYSCGPGSPFEKMLELNAKVLFWDVGFEVMCFIHYLEDRFKDYSPTPVYLPEPLEATIIGNDARKTRLKFYVFDRQTIPRQNFNILKEAVVTNELLKIGRIGNTKLYMIRLRDTMMRAQKLVESGTYFMAGSN